jgi:hypothetical protein
MACSCGVELPRLTASAAHPPHICPPTVDLIPGAPTRSLSNGGGPCQRRMKTPQKRQAGGVRAVAPSGEVGHAIEIAVDRDDAVAGDAAPFRSTAWNALAGSPWRLGWQGAGVSAIARRTGLDRKRVRKVIARGLEPPIYGPRQRRMPQLQPTGQDDRVEELYWSLWKERWTRAGPLGRAALSIDRALEFMVAEDIFWTTP